MVDAQYSQADAIIDTMTITLTMVIIIHVLPMSSVIVTPCIVSLAAVRSPVNAPTPHPHAFIPILTT